MNVLGTTTTTRRSIIVTHISLWLRWKSHTIYFLHKKQHSLVFVSFLHNIIIMVCPHDPLEQQVTISHTHTQLPRFFDRTIIVFFLRNDDDDDSKLKIDWRLMAKAQEEVDMKKKQSKRVRVKNKKQTVGVSSSSF